MRGVVSKKSQCILIVFVLLCSIAILRSVISFLSAEPEIALSLGEPWEVMRKRSTVKIAPAIPGEIWFRTPKSDARLRFIDPQYGFETPLARFFTIGFEYGQVVDIRMSPQIEPLLLDDALKVVLDLQDQWRAGGWLPMRRISSPPFADTPEWRTRLRDVNKGGVTYWQAGVKYQILLGLNLFDDKRYPDQERYLITLGIGSPWLPEHIE